MSTTGKAVRVASISFPVGKSLEEIVACVEEEAARGVDLIALPETWRGQSEGTAELLDGPTITAMAAVAKRHGTYIVCPIDRMDGARRLNSAVVIDRTGDIAAIYDKVYPYWSEFDLSPEVEVGVDPVVVQTDFGKVGLAICFDVNFPEPWQAMADQGADLVIWPSAYSAGSALQAHALMHHYYIVTSTQTGDCQIFDITGARILDERSDGINVSRALLDLDRGVYHHNFNLGKRDQLLRDHDDVEEEAFFGREHWFVLRGRTPEVGVRDLARDYGLEELRAYKARSLAQIDARRARQ